VAADPPQGGCGGDGMSRLVQPTRILVVGSGGREHALAWKLAAEPGVNDVLVAPGSDGIATEPRVRCEPVDPLDGAAVVDVARRFAAELVVIGPEAPLAAGVGDALVRAGFAVFGPSAVAAGIESSKAFCREVADAAGIQMARGRAFAETDPSSALSYAMGLSSAGRVVVKADGLAAGKGVTVCDGLDQAADAIAAHRGGIIVEERLVGAEASVMAICDGRSAVALPIARDHKRLLDGDRGPNTGGMGAYSPLPDLADDAADVLLDRFHRPVLAELARRGTPFVGVLYAGLMLTDEGPRLLEFNARFGDPETQAILPRLAAPLGPVLLAAARGRLDGIGRAATLPGATCGIVLATAGYPEVPEPGDRIEGLPTEADSALIFHAATRRTDDGGWITAGGRVLTVVGRGSDLVAARAAAEAAANRISWRGHQRRRDIAMNPAGVAA
jgi:phosphoribosylamine---glycine ligase